MPRYWTKAEKLRIIERYEYVSREGKREGAYLLKAYGINSAVIVDWRKQLAGVKRK